ncbi:ashwin-like [Lytechinus variegatus]|uniref:ashwin-like n=1 Tax=Lytechinus variegatus TaxID=7654 RepID=UPI001BB1CD1F|nr:ashwin-like [Lytechinus variegatus]
MRSNPMPMEGITQQTDLLQPELLPKETLVSILEQRHIKLDGEQREDKDVLVQIFLRTVTPQPQRQPRSNRRGQITAKVIKKLNVRRIRSKSESEKSSSIDSSKQQKRSQAGGLLMSIDLPLTAGSTSRLKPPPIALNKTKSIVKLTPGKTSDKTSPSSSSPTSGVRKLVISPPSSSTTPKSTKLKVFNSSAAAKSNETLPKSGDTGTLGHVSLKRPSVVENGEKPMDTSEGAPPKPKIKKISWP